MTSWRVIEADCIEAMAAMDEASVDAIVCDPPYGLEFMGKEWDRLGEVKRAKRGAIHNMVNPDGSQKFKNEMPAFDLGASANRRMQEWHLAWATEALRVLKPGGHLLAFGGTRTYHRLTCAIEDAGFEIRDCIAWLYGSGFPKSRNLDGDWQGWGTALKPAYEPIVVARKPLAGTVAANVQRYGTGALNIDGCRIATDDDLNGGAYAKGGTERDDGWGMQRGQAGEYEQPAGRWPANVALDPEAAAMLDEQSGERKSAKPSENARYGEHRQKGINSVYAAGLNSATPNTPPYGDTGGASRFFYCAKASRGERNAGLDGFDKRNHHPTVKPIELMRWLVRLVTPPGGLVLDPFAGSGTTGCAAVLEGLDFIGIERESEYAAIARARTEFWAQFPGQDVEAVLAADARARKQREAGQETLLPAPQEAE